jgi:alkanesulfonate monooxygenase SsuD/methylene tetrahydromethanopterin reductase-like flavin-dependent oxidoreductase (luciferase family)
MKFGAVFWVHRTSWPALREAVCEAERAGFDSIWTDDHLLPVQGDPHSDKYEGWTLVSAFATLTTRPTVGVLVSSTTFRNPALMAKMAVTLDHVSEGRAVLGLGSGYYELEHRAYGLDFGASAGERLERMDEATMLIRRLLEGEVVTHRGRFYQLDDIVTRPRPIQERLPIMIGGMGRTRTLATIARYGDMWNAFGTLEEIAEGARRLDQHCADVGRRTDEIERTVIRHVAVRDDRERAHRDWQDISDRHMPSEINPESLQIGGSPGDVAAEHDRLVDAGFSHAIWVFRDPYDLETMARLGEVRTAMRAEHEGPP